MPTFRRSDQLGWGGAHDHPAAPGVQAQAQLLEHSQEHLIEQSKCTCRSIVAATGHGNRYRCARRADRPVPVSWSAACGLSPERIVRRRKQSVCQPVPTWPQMGALAPSQAVGEESK